MSLQHPQITQQNDFPLYYKIYLHIIAVFFRNLISLLIPGAALHDFETTIPTPGCGSGACKVHVFLPQTLKPPSNTSNTSNSLGAKQNHKVLLVINLEGGGFCSGSPKMGTQPCAYMSKSLNAVVLSMDYAKSPAHPYPHALLQIPFVVAWAATHIPSVDPSNVTIGGSSAGGCLAASFAILASWSRLEELDEKSPLRVLPDGFRLRGLYLLCPSLNAAVPYGGRMGTSSTPEAARRSLPVWLASAMEDMYLPPPIVRYQPTVAPCTVDQEMLRKAVGDGRFPGHAVVVTAELDCLALEGKAFAGIMEQAEVQVRHREWKGVEHGFTQEWPKKGDGKENEKCEAVKAWDAVIEGLRHIILRQNL